MRVSGPVAPSRLGIHCGLLVSTVWQSKKQLSLIGLEGFVKVLIKGVNPDHNHPKDRPPTRSTLKIWIALLDRFC
jgi:hypothetical protein